MNGIKYYNYDCVEDILEEALETLCGIEIQSFNSLKKDVEYVCGAINIVKLGDTPNTLKHKNKNKWSEDIKISDSYKYAEYYKLSEIEKLVDNHLCRKHYNNDLL